jgi:hypothetical protein
VIGKDRIVPPESDPVDLSVFCVEPGRWVATSEHFGASEAMYGSAVGGPRANTRVPMAMMAQPSVRAKAMGDKNQAEVWDEVRKQREAVSMEVAPAASIASREVANTSSYARLMENEEVKKQVDAVARPIEQNYQSLIRQLRDRNAVGIVVAVNGRIIWADVFASTDLLQKYWPKLVRSYASEAVVTRAKEVEVNVARAQAFLAHGRTPGNDRERAWNLSSHRSQRRRIQGFLADISTAEDGVRRARCQDGRVRTEKMTQRNYWFVARSCQAISRKWFWEGHGFSRAARTADHAGFSP